MDFPAGADQLVELLRRTVARLRIGRYRLPRPTWIIIRILVSALNLGAKRKRVSSGVESPNTLCVHQQVFMIVGKDLPILARSPLLPHDCRYKVLAP